MLNTTHLPISQPYKLIISTYLLIHSKNLAKMALNNLHLDAECAKGTAFIDTDQGREISNMYFSDLINFEDKLDETMDSVKLLINSGYLKKDIKKEIKRVLNLVI